MTVIARSPSVAEISPAPVADELVGVYKTDPMVGKLLHYHGTSIYHKFPVHRGARGKYYYFTNAGKRSYVTDRILTHRWSIEFFKPQAPPPLKKERSMTKKVAAAAAAVTQNVSLSKKVAAKTDKIQKQRPATASRAAALQEDAPVFEEAVTTKKYVKRTEDSRRIYVRDDHVGTLPNKRPVVAAKIPVAATLATLLGMPEEEAVSQHGLLVTSHMMKAGVGGYVGCRPQKCGDAKKLFASVFPLLGHVKVCLPRSGLKKSVRKQVQGLFPEAAEGKLTSLVQLVLEMTAFLGQKRKKELKVLHFWKLDTTQRVSVDISIVPGSQLRSRMKYIKMNTDLFTVTPPASPVSSPPVVVTQEDEELLMDILGEICHVM